MTQPQPPVLTVEGQRLYIKTSYGCPCVQALKKLGCKPEYRDGKFFAWWVGAAKRDAVEKVIAESAGKEPVKQNPDDIRLTGKGLYKGREYYAGAVTKDGTRVRLLTLLDEAGKYLDFYVNCELVEQTKSYQPREYRGQTVYTTLGSIAKFVKQQREAESKGLPGCAACGKRGQLTHDLEDGLMKCYSCCDIPEAK